jgi:hypothetical protein
MSANGVEETLMTTDPLALVRPYHDARTSRNFGEAKVAMITPKDRFATIVETLVGEPGVTPPAAEAESNRKFGANGLKVDTKIFAMLVRGKLVVKLPRERVDSLIAAHHGEPFDRGQGRPMKEWVTVPPASDADWLALAREAMAFVATRR